MLKVKFKDNRLVFNSDHAVNQHTAPDLCEMINAENVLLKVKHEKVKQTPEVQSQNVIAKPRSARNIIAPKVVVKKFEYVNDSEEHLSEPEQETEGNEPTSYQLNRKKPKVAKKIPHL